MSGANASQCVSRLKRAEQIRRAWKDVPQAPAPKPDHTEEPDETGSLEDEETREAA